MQHSTFAPAEYRAIVKSLLNFVSMEEILTLWNESGKGKPAKLTTIKRWLSPGPATKNPRFEPWIAELNAAKLAAQQERKLSLEDVNALVLASKLEDLEVAVIRNNFNSDKQRATAASHVAYAKHYPLSDSQVNTVNSLHTVSLIVADTKERERQAILQESMKDDAE